MSKSLHLPLDQEPEFSRLREICPQLRAELSTVRAVDSQLIACYNSLIVVAVAQSVERLPVEQVVTGSSPVSHPILDSLQF